MSHDVRCPHCGQPVPILGADDRASEGDRPSLAPQGAPTGFPPPGGTDADRDMTPTPAPTLPPALGSLGINERLWHLGDDVDVLRTPDPDTGLGGLVWTPQDPAGAGVPPDEVPTVILARDRVPESVVEAADRWESSLTSEPVASASRSNPVEIARTPGWIVWLASYASAVTLACLWLLWQARQPSESRREPTSAETTLQASRDGRRGALSARVATLPPLHADQITNLDQPLRVGDLEITPRSVQVEALRLERVGLTGKTESRPGLPGTLVLRLELTNRSTDAVFAPLDEAFVRPTDAGPPPGFVEGKDGARVYLYPLPESGEWGLVGQRFNALRPGERIETLVASDEGALGRLDEGPYRWRLRLRVGPDPGAIQDIGVRLTREQIR